MQRNGTARRFCLLVLAVMAANDATSVIANLLTLPFFLDTWATSAGVMIGGLTVGVCGGALYNALMALSYWTPGAAVFGLNSVLVAVLTWTFWRSGWVDIEKPFKLVAVGAITGLVNAALVMGVELFSNPATATAKNTLIFHHMLESEIGSSSVALILETLLIEVTDKTVSIFVAAAVVVLLQERFSWALPAGTQGRQA